MQAKNLKGGQELLCINTQKVYDWIINEATFDLNLTLDDVELPNGISCDDLDITCEVTPDEVNPFVILNREDRPFMIDGSPITLQLVTIQKNFDVSIFVNGITAPIATESFTRCEQVILCAPDGTDVEVTYTDLDCFVCVFNCEDVTPGVSLELGITVRLCQSIQSVFDVTLELVADFCQPRDILPFTPVCPTPTIPPQCPVLFPTNGDED
ncbi:hypothetical protein ACFFHM_05695 [Halalkalibacter kiskunsagensis]|uniref:Uncharacterized protein n=1 Tax=Halalkalibacter kiskunsagensis TaxID=1548599 RepID=A0ABV6K9Q3_9BACI